VKEERKVIKTFLEQKRRVKKEDRNEREERNVIDKNVRERKEQRKALAGLVRV
jgi:hypothetical protein